MLAEMPKVKDEATLYNGEEGAALRKKCIEAWNSEPNLYRKSQAFKGYECLKDKTVNYVLDTMMRMFDLSTVQEMQYAMTNISILRKVISKLSKVYANGVKRTMPTADAAPATEAKKPKIKVMDSAPVDPSVASQGEAPANPEYSQDESDSETDALIDGDVIEENPETQAIEEMAKYLKLNTQMKKCDRYFRTFKNTLAHPRPVKNASGFFDLRVDILPPYSYDVIENPDNPEEALAIVVSNYKPRRKTMYVLGDAAMAGRSAGMARQVNESIASSDFNPADDDKAEYIWWTKSYHFTTNSKGEIISNKTNGDPTQQDKNPINELPFVNFAGEQDGEFWAKGGDDLIDSGVQINVALSNINHIGISQGHGQLYLIGKGLPASTKVGPNYVIKLEVESKEDPEPKIGYLNANPQLDELRNTVEMCVALMLTTNNLSTRGVSLSMTEGRDLTSGVAMILDKSESTEDINDQAEIFRENEPKIWKLVGLWQEVYAAADVLSEDCAKIKLPKNPENVQLDFPEAKAMVSESEELDVIKKRRDMGLNTRMELIMRDNPSLTEKEAQEKLDKIDAEKKQLQAEFGPITGEGSGGLELSTAPTAAPGGGAPAPGAKPSGNQSQKSGGVGGGNQLNNQSGAFGGGKAPGKSKVPNKK